MKTLPPLVLTDKYWRAVDKEINRLFWDILFKPIVKTLQIPQKELKNSRKSLTDAVASGRIFYDGSEFRGDFNATISKQLKTLGAKYNGVTKTWKYSGALPPQISIAVARAQERYQGMASRLVQTLDQVQTDKINTISRIPDIYDGSVDAMALDVDKTMKTINIPAKLTQAQRGAIAAEWGMNLDKYVKDWLSENILDLRQTIQRNTLEGRRSQALIGEIQKKYAVSRNKARFLARQETSLLMSKVRETRYKDAGLDKYVWRGAMDEREREDHRILEGKVFTWDNPPITNRDTGARNHPGEDFNCRCVAVPIVE